MSPLYLLPILPPKMPACEALSQEIAELRRQFGGQLLYLNPNRGIPFYIPRLLFGLHKLGQLRQLENTIDLHHFYNPDPFPFPVLTLLKRPIVYTISSGVTDRRPNLSFFSKLAAIAVPDERSLRRLQDWGLKNVFLVRSGVDIRRFAVSPLPLKKELRLLVGSAPWTKGQFRTKGVEALLEAAQQSPDLRLTFLWRGVLFEEMSSRVKKMRLSEQVTVINQQVNVNQLLASHHAAITLASAPGLIKSYPHSLLDSLAAGKPVLVNRQIPMSDYVAQTGCGIVLEQMTTLGILAAVENLRQRYDTLRQIAEIVGQRDFSEEAMVESYRTVYQAACCQSD